MPLIGYLGRLELKEYISEYDSIIAFVLLFLIGLKIIYESFQENVENTILIISNKILFTLAIATSIDAMVAGFTLHLFNLNPIYILILIGFITLLMSILGIYIGSHYRSRYGSKAEILGGVILILIGLKFLF